MNKYYQKLLFDTKRRATWQQQGPSELTPSIFYEDIEGIFQKHLIF